jgi:transposase
MAVGVSAIRPVAHLPLVLGMLRKLEVAAVIDRLLPPHPDNVLSCGTGVEALVLAILDGHHVLYKVGQRLEERGMLSLLQPGLQRLSLNDYRLGQILDALFAANLNKVFSALALQALAIYALPTLWIHQDTTTITLYGAYAGLPEPTRREADAEADKEATPVAPRPAHGYNKDGHPELKQVLLSLGVSGDGGLPLRLGLRDGNTSDSTETPLAIEECLALGLQGVRGIVADSKAYSQRTLGLCLEKKIGLVTRVPRTCAIRQELEAWGQQQALLPSLLEKPGHTSHDTPRCWRGKSVLRSVDVEYADGHIQQAELRFVVIHSSTLAQQETHAAATAHTKEAERVTAHIQQVTAQQYACAADAEAAIAAYEGRAPRRRGRKPRPWRSHRLCYRVEPFMQRLTRRQRGRPTKTDPPPMAQRYRVVVEVEAVEQAEDDHGWTVLATTVDSAVSTDAEIVQAYHDQHSTVEPGFRWIKNPAAITPVWLEKPERIAALAMLTVVGLLVYALIQRQVRLYLHEQQQYLPGNKGLTATPTAAVILTLFSPIMLVQLMLDTNPVLHIYGVQPHHLLVCDALGIDQRWYAAPSHQENSA